MKICSVRTLRAFYALLAALVLTEGLVACAPLVVGGGAVAGAMIAADRRTAGSQLEDQGIELRAMSRIRELLGDGGHVNVTSYNRQVLLTGEVPSPDLRAQVEQVAQGVDNVRLVVNELVVAFNSSLVQRSNDTFITGKVRARLLEARDLPAKALKVVTERSEVYLLGRVTRREADQATELARSVNGVRKVVRMFETISEEELHQMTARPASQSESADSAAQQELPAAAGDL